MLPGYGTHSDPSGVLRCRVLMAEHGAEAVKDARSFALWWLTVVSGSP
jgi:hypothetical protein